MCCLWGGLPCYVCGGHCLKQGLLFAPVCTMLAWAYQLLGFLCLHFPSHLGLWGHRLILPFLASCASAFTHWDCLQPCLDSLELSASLHVNAISVMKWIVIRIDSSSLQFLKKHLFYVYECFSVMYRCTKLCVLGTLRCQKKALDLLELEFQMLVSHSVSARNWTQVLYKNCKYFYPRQHSRPILYP